MRIRHQKGFSIIEVLVALFVFAIGILTVAGLQIVSKRSNHEAIQRTAATYLAYDMLERMRANPYGLAEYIDTTLGAFRTEPATKCNANACNHEQLADFDVWEWQQAILGVAEKSGAANTGGLVNPTGCITGPAGGGQGIYTVTIVWQGVDALTNSSTSACGSDNKNADEYGANYEYRRILEISSFIAP